MNKWIICIILLCCTSCSQKEWISSSPLPYKYDDIWNTSYQIISKHYDIISASKEKRTLETEWKQKMSLHYMDSFQNKVYLKIEDYQEEEDSKNLPKPVELQKGISEQSRYILKICVLQEQNRNIDNPSVVSQASWYSVGSNIEESHVLINFIVSKLRVGEIGIETNEESK
ncbi:MAG: hypothetical protein KBC30_08395 [Planctomycetes bacterium]|jgi:hypothetical protein|nr:hypothetical protein [Planctomycetota bacterium]